MTCRRPPSGRPGRQGSGPRSRSRSACTSATCSARPGTCEPGTTGGGSAAWTPGRFEDAREIPVAIFPQHTSRNGDPQLHVHILWLNRVETVRDGKWRSIDSRGLHRNKGAGSALAAFALETGLTRRFGFEWAYRPASARAGSSPGSRSKAISAVLLPTRADHQDHARARRASTSEHARPRAGSAGAGEHAPIRQRAHAPRQRSRAAGLRRAAARLGAGLARRRTRNVARPRAEASGAAHPQRTHAQPQVPERAQAHRRTRPDGSAACVYAGN